METIRVLILRLQQQSEQQAVPSELLATVQQLEAALQQAMAEPVRQIRSGNISVVFPSGNRLHTAPPQNVPEPARVEVKEVRPEPARAQVKEVVSGPGRGELKESAPESARPESTEAASGFGPGQFREVVPESGSAQVREVVPGPGRAQFREVVPESASVELKQSNPGLKEKASSGPMPQESEPVSVAENFHLSFEKEDEAKKQPGSQQMEMNDSFGQSSSLNDRMRADHLEVGSVLNEEPVKDLRRAIGINDRFVYLNELFRGDELMYERSLKTINNFRIFPEAEYWIERELKVKLGWDENKETVKQFRQLVKRRFQV